MDTVCLITPPSAFLMDERVIQAVKEGITEEISKAAAEITTSVGKGDLGERAIAFRREQAEALQLKVAKYESMLGPVLQQCKDVLEETKQQTMMATLALAGSGF